MIICAAIKLTNLPEDDSLNDLIICGLRHGDCFEVLAGFNTHIGLSHSIQGFINHKSEFLDRYDAYIHALECGQLSSTTRQYKLDKGETELYSEDLY